MEQMAHELKFAVDGVINADHVFTNVGRLRDGRDVLAGAEGRVRKGARIEFEDRVLVDQVGGNGIDGATIGRVKGLALSQAVRCVELELVVIRGERNNGGRTACCYGVRQGRASCGEVVGLDGIRSGWRASLNQPAPLFIHKEEGSLARVVVDVGNEEWST